MHGEYLPAPTSMAPALPNMPPALSTSPLTHSTHEHKWQQGCQGPRCRTFHLQGPERGRGHRRDCGRHRVWTRRVAVCRELRPYVTRAGGTLGCHRSHRSGELLPLPRLLLLAASLRHQATSAALVDRGPLHCRQSSYHVHALYHKYAHFPKP